MRGRMASQSEAERYPTPPGTIPPGNNNNDECQKMDDDDDNDNTFQKWRSLVVGRCAVDWEVPSSKPATLSAVMRVRR